MMYEHHHPLNPGMTQGDVKKINYINRNSWWGPPRFKAVVMYEDFRGILTFLFFFYPVSIIENDCFQIIPPAAGGAIYIFFSELLPTRRWAPSPVINGVITPISKPVTHWFSTIYRGHMSLHLVSQRVSAVPGSPLTPLVPAPQSPTQEPQGPPLPSWWCVNMWSRISSIYLF